MEITINVCNSSHLCPDNQDGCAYHRLTVISRNNSS